MQSAECQSQSQASCGPGTPASNPPDHKSYGRGPELTSSSAGCSQQLAAKAAEASPPDPAANPALHACPADSPRATSPLPSGPYHATTGQLSSLIPQPSLSPGPYTTGPGPCSSSPTAARPEDVWTPDILPRIASFLSPNIIACTLRLVNQQAASQFAAHTRVRLSQPVPPPVFAAKWAVQGGAACRCLGLKHRQLLVCFAAASGVVENLNTALRVCGCTPTEVVMQEAVWAAAASGALACLARLRRLLLHRGTDESDPQAAGGRRSGSTQIGNERSGSSNDEVEAGPFEEYEQGGEGEDAAVGTVVAPSLQGPLFFAHALIAAAGRGQRAVVELCLRRKAADAWSGADAWISMGAVWAAARGGHVGLMWELWERFRAKRAHAELGDGAEAWLEAAAEGCPLAELRKVAELFEPVFVVQREDPANSFLASMLTLAAARSRTPDWADKLTWLEEWGCLDLTCVCKGAVSAPDSASRLEWMRSEPRAWPLLPELVQAAADAENLEALRYLLSKGVRPADERNVAVLPCAPTHALPWTCDGRPSPLLPAYPPRLDLLEELRAAGVATAVSNIALQAAYSNAVEVIAWVWRHFPSRARCDLLSSMLLTRAAMGGATDALRLVCAETKACPQTWDWLWQGAAGSGRQEALEWLAEVGCPMPVHNPRMLYLPPAHAGDLLTLSTLHRLGLPFDRHRRNPLMRLRGRGRATKLFTWAIFHKWFSCGAPLPALQLLLELGAPVDWAKALRAADFRPGYNGREEVRAWVEAEWRRRQGLRAGWGIAAGRWWRNHTPQRWW